MLARHVEGASHMAEGYTRAKAGNIGVCIGTSGPAGTDMITGLVFGLRPTAIPILCITGQAPRARSARRKTSRPSTSPAICGKPVTKWADHRAWSRLSGADVPFQQAFLPDALGPPRDRC
jgi:glyoxylate carboligase